MSPRPADECPYRRPFPPGFSACPTYRPAGGSVAPASSQQHSQAADWTCTHLDVGTSTTAGRYYARCSLGTAADRAHLAAAKAEPQRELPGRHARRASEAGPTAS